MNSPNKWPATSSGVEGDGGGGEGVPAGGGGGQQGGIPAIGAVPATTSQPFGTGAIPAVANNPGSQPIPMVGFATGGLIDYPTPAIQTQVAERARSALQQNLYRLFSPSASVTDHTFSWRSTNNVTPAKDQNPCGCCYIFGSIAAFEANWSITHGGSFIHASEQRVLNCAVGDCFNGGTIRSAMEWLHENGTCDSETVSYEARKNNCLILPQNTTIYKAVTWAWVREDAGIPDVATLKDALIKHGPIAIWLCAGGQFASFWQTSPDAVITEDSNVGAHIIAITGWDDDKSAWEVKNSWGPTWGNQGFGWVRYGIRQIGLNAAWIAT